MEIELPKIEPLKGKRKVLRLKTQEFLYQIFPDRITTTNNVKHALDLRTLDFATIDNILHNLYNAGYRECKVIEVN